MRLIVLSGYHRVGKDAVAEALMEMDPVWQRHAIVDLLNEMALKTNPYLPCGWRLADVVAECGWVEAKADIRGGA